MAWDALAALGSIAGALILLVGSIAAVVQLKHLRLANQIGAYLDIMQRFNSAEMVEARTFIDSHDFADPAVLAKVFENGLDHRALQYGGLCQTVARLINLRILDWRLFSPVILAATQSWRGLRPIAYELRKRGSSNLRWLDVECLVYRSQFELFPERIAPRAYFPQNVLDAVGFPESLEKARREAAELAAPPNES